MESNKNGGFFNRGIFGDGEASHDKMKMVLIGEEEGGLGVRDGQVIGVKEFRFSGIA